MTKKIRVLIADDHPVVRRGLAQFFGEERDLEVVGEAVDGEEALAEIQRTKPDVVIADLRMPRMGGLELLERLRDLEERPAVIVLAGNISDDEVIQAMRLGVKGVVLKEMASALLVQCVRKVAAGGVWLEKEAVGRAMEKLLQPEAARTRARDTLTARELDIVRMVARGLGNREVAEQLFISEGTVKSHLHTIYEKLGLRGRVQLATFARENGWVERS